MLDAQHAHCALAVDDRNAGEGMEFLFTGFRAIGEVRMRLGFGKVERFDTVGDRAGQALTDGHPGDVDRALVQTARSKEFEHAFAQQIDRAHLACEAFPDDVDHPVELALRMHARGHNLVKAGENLSGGSGG